VNLIERFLSKYREGSIDAYKCALISLSRYTGIIEALIRVLDKITDANIPLEEAAALYAISSLVSHKTIIPFNTSSNFFANDTVYGIKLNVWFSIIGPIGLSRMSTLANAVKKYLKAVLGANIVSQIFLRLKDLLIHLMKMIAYFHGQWMNLG